ncbi:TPA: sulfatase-like hydrolase/transferase [Salmonella enterica]|uniref:sulfatase-like hydrolase/transferase n=1 Tax=Salmonella enterica TaxID=28901 RepID=UPI0009E7014E|nr:sulfatase-like hydrolase/transferase [Salmonella enterica]EBQ5243598.1 sulfatase-like hydrolase/transferase [Salmonella enterica subsp. salamae]EDQ7937529.1 sulfatase-like hydrolase/transferase [Salmonella enterica]EJE1292067.1 sulfatase-like hydrolase/transferase [Salmonella enterica]EJF1555152.1 sulfatase-like hydrolase/transferase [Salmonella enterica]HAF9730381.1 sulfatase-like hydrolase/transferase [Salmonella enterica]
MKQRQHSLIIIIGLIIVSYGVNKVVFARDSSIPFLSTLSFLLISFYLLRCKNLVPRISGYFLIFLLSSEISYFIVFNEQISFDVISSVVETNLIEAKGMFLSDGVKIIGIAIILTLAISYGIIKLYKNHDNFKWIPGLAIFLYLLTALMIVNDVWPQINDIKMSMNESRSTIGKLIKSYFPAVIGDVAYFASTMILNDRYSNTSIIPDFNESITGKAESGNNTIVIVMGESSLFSRYSIYGYPKLSSPDLQKIFTQPKSCIVRNVHSSAPETRDSLAMTFSFSTPESDTNLFKNKSIIEMAKANGYKTWWIGSQELEGLFSSKYGFIARKSDVVRLTNGHDEHLVSMLTDALEDTSAPKKFIIVHLLGNHKPYHNYDAEDKKALPGAEEYDLTIHKTDRVVSSLFNDVAKHSKNYIFLYTSDHGEVVNKGHGLMKGKDQWYIPFLYKSTNDKFDCSFIEQFRNKDGWLSGLMNKYILSRLIGYTLDKNIVNNEMNNDRVKAANEKPVLFKDTE